MNCIRTFFEESKFKEKPEAYGTNFQNYMRLVKLNKPFHKTKRTAFEHHDLINCTHEFVKSEASLRHNF